MPEGSWRKRGGTAAVDIAYRKLNRLICVLIGLVTFGLPEPNGDGTGDPCLTKYSMMGLKCIMFMEAQQKHVPL